MKRLYLILTLAIATVTVQAAVGFDDGDFSFMLNTSNNWVACLGLS